MGGDMATRRKPQIVLRNGQPSAVILDIETYREMLERLEEQDDLKELERMRSKPLTFRKLEEFLREQGLSV
jgi:PHD/YefM family antitoxin component YafN of YafNO toxin-antitoxin module